MQRTCLLATASRSRCAYRSRGNELRPAGHRRRHQWRRHSPRCCRPRALGAAGRARRSGSGDLVGVLEADPWRAALSRAVRVPPGRRGARRARDSAAHCRAPGLAGAVRHAASAGAAAAGFASAAGPWVRDVLNQRLGQPSRDAVRLVKGSHIVLPRLYDGEHAFILQNDDRRVVFMIPWEEHFTLVGTTDIPVAAPDHAEATQDEVDYLCRAVNRYLERPVAPHAVLWRYAGVRPLYDDGSSDPSAVTRDYTLRLDAAADEAPVLSGFGGKITTYRRLAEHALEKLAPYFPRLPGAWTGQAALPGSDFKDREEARKELLARHRDLPPEVLQGVFRRHGTRAIQVLGDGQLGEHFGAGLTERELRYFIEREWARSAQDVLWRRTKAGLHLDQRARARVEAAFGR